MKIVRATQDDIAFIMATERLPGYDELVGYWDAARHAEALADDSYAYFIARDGDTPVGFAIIRDWNAADQVSLLMRIAVAEPGQGHGRAFLPLLIDRVFEDTGAHRLWLGVYPHNERARRAYEAAGFQAEGIARGIVCFGGIHRDELIMAILRPDWQALREAAPPAR